MDPSMVWALKLKQMVEERLVSYRNIFREMKKQKSQTEIMMYFHKVILNVPASPSTSSNSSASATPETARPTPSLLPPPQLTQCEDDEDEELYDDPLPLNGNSQN